MPSEAKIPDTPSRPDAPATTREEIELDRLANEAAGQAAKTEQRYDREQDIFTK
jgi:hypothetical protein